MPNTMPKKTKTAGAANAGGPQKTQCPAPIVPPAPAVGQSAGGRTAAEIYDAETNEIRRRIYKFKPVIDVTEAYQYAVRDRLISHFDYLLQKVDDLDQRVLIDAIELMKRTNGTEDDDFLQPGELIEAIQFLLGVGMPEDEAKEAADAPVN